MKKEIDEAIVSQHVGYPAVVAATAATAVVSMAVVYVLYSLIPSDVDLSSAYEMLAGGEFRPEPAERISYVVTLLLSPFLLLAFLKGFDALFSRSGLSGSAPFRRYTTGAFALAVTLLLIPSLYYDFFSGVAKASRFSLVAKTAFFGNAFGVVFFVVFAIFLYYVVFLNEKVRSYFSKFFFAVAMLSIAVVFFMDLLIVDTSLIQVDTNHFGVVYNAIVQVVNGKELFYNFPHQYGMYPHFLEPVFRVLSTSVFAVSFVFALLTAACYLLIYRFIYEIMSNKYLASLLFCTLLYLTCFMYKSLHGDYDPYFQYVPIRLLFPALMIYTTYRYFKSKSSVLYTIQFALASVGVLWNFDAGFVVFLTWFATLCYADLCLRDYRKIGKHLAFAALSFLAVFAVFNVYLLVRFGHFPEYSQFFIYQKVFYEYGNFMLPMEPFGVWTFVAVIYLFALARALYGIYERTATAKDAMIFFLAILGCGLFSYYQGRSVISNLFNAMYPMLILVYVFIDEMIELWKRKPYLEYKAVLLISFAVVALITASFAADTPHIAKVSTQRFRELTGPNPDDPIERNAAYIRSRTTPGESVVIISYHAGIYYDLTKTKQDIDLPSLGEWMFKSDYRELEKYLSSGKRIFLDYNAFFNGYFYNSLRPRLATVSTYPGATMVEAVLRR